MSECFSYANCNHKDCDKEFCLRRYKLTNLYDSALLSESQRRHISLRVDSDNTDIEEFKRLANIEANIVDFVKAGKNLFIHSSNCGNGKTSWAIRMIESYFNKIWPISDLTCKALFISVPRFLIALKESISKPNEYADYIKDNILDADLVVWDDIAAKVGSDYEINHLLSLIDSRMAVGKANIYTSNLANKDMYVALGERLASRVCNTSIDIELHGADKRFLIIQE